MPGRDKTGPQGAGSITGRRMGNCADSENKSSGFFGRGGGSPMGRGNKRGFGIGMLGKRNAALSADSHSSSLKKEIVDLKNQLSSLAKEVLGLKNKGVN